MFEVFKVNCEEFEIRFEGDELEFRLDWDGGF
jgi:hypothetical protein